MNKTIAFIGTGAMGGAMIRAACRSIDPAQIILTDYLQEKAEALAAELGCRTAPSNPAAVEAADYVFLCVKPQGAAAVIQEIAPVLRDSLADDRPKLLCSILAGVTTEAIREIMGSPAYPVVRIVANTPALVGNGLMIYACDASVAHGDVADLETILSCCGVVTQLEERLVDQATAVAACSPAFVYMFIEALSDGGVLTGLDRTRAQTFAAQAVYGAAAMVLETDFHPGALKDMVTSPGGSTIAGVAALEEAGFRQAVISAVAASYARNVQLGEVGKG
ncbi:MAG: pyrroline-5-carboxylate reductase [Oscillospiraceae bacterium]|nr:pyrroline-5-carboxylate reductase [Oscillospiraceae bacterium]